DPCRRFTFGTTIENRATRLWLLSRVTLLRTKPFDFIKVGLCVHFSDCWFYGRDRRQLVVVLLSLAFSAMNQTGWDPTIKLSHLDKSGQRQYEIKINNNS
ncbi:hypothetical protein DFH05DRAFT_1406212, partial [Lentinula detonsa]